MDPSPRERANHLEKYRDYLRVLASAGMNPRLRPRIDASDIVQQTLLEAYESLQRFDGAGDAAEAGWLRKILARNLADAGREHRRGKRDVARERSLEAHLGRSSTHLESLLAASDVRPSAGIQREERALRVAEAMRTLSEVEYDALILQHWHGKPYTEIAEILGIDRFAVARCVRRALQKLKRVLAEE